MNDKYRYFYLYIVYVFGSAFIVFLETGNWLVAGLSLIVLGVLAFFSARKETDYAKAYQEKKDGLNFLSSFFSWRKIASDPKTAYESAAPLFKERMLPSYEEAKGNLTAFDSFPFASLKQALTAGLSPSLDLPYEDIEAEIEERKEETDFPELHKWISSTLTAALAYLIVFALIKIIFKNKLIEYKDAAFTIVFALLSVVPMVAVFLTLLTWRKRK
jgi:hypothetical protein